MQSQRIKSSKSLGLLFTNIFVTGMLQMQSQRIKYSKSPLGGSLIWNLIWFKILWEDPKLTSGVTFYQYICDWDMLQMQSQRIKCIRHFLGGGPPKTLLELLLMVNWGGRRFFSWTSWSCFWLSWKPWFSESCYVKIVIGPLSWSVKSKIRGVLFVISYFWSRENVISDPIRPSWKVFLTSWTWFLQHQFVCSVDVKCQNFSLAPSALATILSVLFTHVHVVLFTHVYIFR